MKKAFAERMHVAPEVEKGERHTNLADVFSLATVLYHILEGRKVFASESAYKSLKMTKPTTALGKKYHKMIKEMLDRDP